MRPPHLIFVVSLLVSLVAPARAAEPMVEQYLLTGKLAEGEKALANHLQANPKDDEARFGLGMLQVVRGLEQLMQTLHKHGLRSERSGVPFLRLPVEQNPNPQAMSYQSASQMVRKWDEQLAQAEKTLAQVQSTEIKLPLHFARIRLDFDGDGQASETEMLWRVYQRLSGF
ncbi:MAG TPA: hypothetical protein VF669_19560, partial [Tepidisphaeraceae bacterium]